MAEKTFVNDKKQEISILNEVHRMLCKHWDSIQSQQQDSLTGLGVQRIAISIKQCDEILVAAYQSLKRIQEFIVILII